MLARVIAARPSTASRSLSAERKRSRRDQTRFLPSSRRSRLICMFCSVGSRLLLGSDYLTVSQGCVSLPASTELNCAALWWPLLQQQSVFKKLNVLGLGWSNSFSVAPCLCLSLTVSLSPPLSFISTCLTPPCSFPRLLPPPFLTAGAELQSVPLLARSPSTNRKYPPLSIDKLEEEINRRMADDNKLFREEFNVCTAHGNTCID